MRASVPNCPGLCLQASPPSPHPTLSRKSLGTCPWTRSRWVPALSPAGINNNSKPFFWFTFGSAVSCRFSRRLPFFSQGNVYSSRGTSRNPFIWPHCPLPPPPPPPHRDKWTWGAVAISNPLDYFHPVSEEGPLCFCVYVFVQEEKEKNKNSMNVQKKLRVRLWNCGVFVLSIGCLCASILHLRAQWESHVNTSVVRPPHVLWHTCCGVLPNSSPTVKTCFKTIESLEMFNIWF